MSNETSVAAVQATTMDYAAPKSYIQVMQAKLLSKAIVEAKTGSALGDKDKKDVNAADPKKKPTKPTDDDGYKGLMPEWMLIVGTTYAKLDKDYSPNHKLGKYAMQIAANATMKMAANKALSAASSFDMLKQFLDHDTYFQQEGDGVGIAVKEMKDQLDHFSPEGHSSASQIEQQKQSEFNIVMNQSNMLEDEGERDQSVSQSLLSDGKSFLSDGSNVDNYITQMCEAFASTG